MHLHYIKTLLKLEIWIYLELKSELQFRTCIRGLNHPPKMGGVYIKRG
jgi:hypothetical protein